eukprot:jgi/Hompol1/4812/HPOL_003896-RA
MTSGKNPSIREKLLAILESFGYDRSLAGRIELVTTPRIFGYAFNPLSIFFVYKNKDAATSEFKSDLAHGISNDLLLVVLEVNNTFKERHIYLCNPLTRSQSSLSGYQASFSLSRSFHVSPFNNRTGHYDAHLKDIQEGSLDVLLNIKNYTETASLSSPSPQDTPAKPSHTHLMARVYGHAVPMTPWTLIYVIAAFPVNTFLTVPRIMYQAFLLAYRHGLPVYQRPTPFVDYPLSGLFVAFTNGDLFCTCADLATLVQLMSSGRQVTNVAKHAALDLSTANASQEKQRRDRDADSVHTASWLVPIDRTKQPAWSAPFKSGEYLFRTELAWFKRTTKFAQNGEPWLLEDRCHQHAQAFDSNPNDASVAKTRGAISDMRCIPDTIPVFQRERVRAFFFLEATRTSQ